MIHKHQVVRALGNALLVFATSLAVFPTPPDTLKEIWPSLITAVITFLGAMGFGTAVKSPAPSEPEP